MTESKDFRSGTRTLLWEKDKLAMEYQDLQMKWTEIQQTKVQTVFFIQTFFLKHILCKLEIKCHMQDIQTYKVCLSIPSMYIHL